MPDQPGLNPDADEAQSVDPYYEDEWYEDDYDEAYGRLEHDCPFCMGPCGNCEAVHAELAALPEEERAAYMEAYRDVMAAVAAFNSGAVIHFGDLDESSDPASA